VSAGQVLAIHDTTLCQFGGEEVREGAFRTAKSKSGFLAHTCLGVAADGSRNPLGVLGMLPVVRLTGEDAQRSAGLVYEVESQRWVDLVAIVEDEMPEGVDVVHVMDSEGDAYDLFEFMVQQEANFVVRMCHNRRVVTQDGDARLQQEVDTAPVRLTRTARLSKRKGERGQKVGKRHTARDERTCTLEVRATAANLLRPDASEAFLATLHLNVVYVVEAEPPADMEPVSWALVTTLPSTRSRRWRRSSTRTARGG
jgi:hypothetical protein